MGLDSVELVIAVEGHFDIEIPDRKAQKLVTVGLLHSFIVSELQRLGRSTIDREAIFSELRGLICKQLSIKPERVVPDARFVQDLYID